MLLQELSTLEEKTGLNEIKMQIQFLDDKEGDKLVNEFYKVRMRMVLEAVNVEVTSVIGPSWSILCQQSDGMWASHTLLVLWLAINNEFYKDLAQSEKNILKWACLLHEIKKRGKPIILGNDHIHSFRSAKGTLQIFEELNFIKTAKSKDDYGLI